MDSSDDDNPLTGIPGDELDLMNVVLAHHAIVSGQRDFLTGGNRDKGTAWIYLWSKDHLAWRFYEARHKPEERLEIVGLKELFQLIRRLRDDLEDGVTHFAIDSVSDDQKFTLGRVVIPDELERFLKQAIAKLRDTSKDG